MLEVPVKTAPVQESVEETENSAKIVPDTETLEAQTEEKSEEKTEEKTEERTINSVTTVPDTESCDGLNEQNTEKNSDDAVKNVSDPDSLDGQNEAKVSEENTEEEEEVKGKSPSQSNTEGQGVVPEDLGDSNHQEDALASDEAMEVEALENRNSSVAVENTPGSVPSPVQREPQENIEEIEKEAEENIGENENQDENKIDENETEMDNLTPVSSTTDTVKLSDIVSLVNDEEFDPDNLANDDLKTLLTNIFDHSIKVEAMKKKVVQVLARRLN